MCIHLGNRTVMEHEPNANTLAISSFLCAAIHKEPPLNMHTGGREEEVGGRTATGRVNKARAQGS